ncbi:hypothetical protein [Pseudarthrobacter sp. fls2-241-R2A-127]|uniref:hypothetical protein n=1 Tax=Pseudarthrobacter sp. fls2-241-R2A-127 TaxID=3040303 RepID=UPI002556D9C4|nr:hypothetical protein [Pseudarthrobacter sp. fls2-241-R2A-127]
MRPEAGPGTDSDRAAAPGAQGRRRGTRVLILVGIAVAASLVAGAAASGPGRTDQGLLRGFQIRVLGISQAAAEDRMDGALSALQALEKDLGEAAADGRISPERYNGIESALGSVRADISARVAAAARPEAPAADPPGVDLSGAPAGTGTDPAEPAVAAVAQEPAPVANVPGAGRSAASKEAKGKAKGQGKP